MSEIVPTFGGRTLEEINSESVKDRYIQHHPDAVVDKDKAEVMAYASKVDEERVVEAANDAVKFAGAVAAGSVFEFHRDDEDVQRASVRGMEKYGTPYSYEELRDQSIKEAQQARTYADLAAKGAADQYERTRSEIQTIVAQAEALKRGESVPELEQKVEADRQTRSKFGSPM